MSELKSYIRSRYGQAARRVQEQGNALPATAPSTASCCGTTTSSSAPAAATCCDAGSDASGAPDPDSLANRGYSGEELALLPAEAVLASLGCGNPTAVAQLQPGEVVLDLGSGGGIDVLLSARRVGPTGKAYGLDMTDEMLALARENQRKAGIANAEFLKGDIEAIPLPDNSVDVIISNCVINLAADKDRVLHEALRVLKPGGRLAISDIIFVGDKSAVPVEIRTAMEAWAGCVAGALEQQEYLKKLQTAGFKDATVEPVQFYDTSAADGAATAGSGCCGGSSSSCCSTEPAAALPPDLPVRLASGLIRAKKPVSPPLP